MPRPDFRTPRLFLDAPLIAGAACPLDRNQSNYLGNVLRMAAGDRVLVFNGRDGEWQATVIGRKRPEGLMLESLTRPQQAQADVRYVFAPLKHARLDYMAQKAVEMGATALIPVMTLHTQVARLNTERMRANVIEAAEQCGILTIAAIDAPVSLPHFLERRDSNRLLVFCDEDAEQSDAVSALGAMRGRTAAGIDVLIGPEGGFAQEERTALLQQPVIARLSLGPRILRADTAAVAALMLVQAILTHPHGKQITI